jgi:hypothetical protein
VLSSAWKPGSTGWKHRHDADFAEVNRKLDAILAAVVLGSSPPA